MQGDSGEDIFDQAAGLQKAGRFGDAAEVYLRLARQALTVNLAINLGVCLNEIGDRAGAEHYLALAARQRPQDAAVRRLLGIAYGESGRIDLAEQEFRAALAAKPADPATELALGALYLSTGRYIEGWPLMAARAELHPDVVPPVAVHFPEWRGEPLEGKSILVWVEQGFGDQIQMARFATTLKARGAGRVTLGCRPALAALFSAIEGVDGVVPVAVGAAAAVGPHDYWSRYFSLAEPLGLTLDTLPAAPYLAAPADRRARWAGAAKGARVGVVWEASPTGFNAANKGLPRKQPQRLLDAGAMSLQPQDTGAEDFADTASIIETLDLVVSIDTAVAHLAGAMGKPCWTLLPYVHCDWRWLRDRADTPWYPTLQLYRQTRPRDWSETVDQVLHNLASAGLA
jgi:tetratricopeptide (TPR) repeat protein